MNGGIWLHVAFFEKSALFFPCKAFRGDWSAIKFKGMRQCFSKASGHWNKEGLHTKHTGCVSVEPKWGEMMEMMVMMLMSCQFTGDEAKTDRTSAKHRPIVNHRPSPLGHGAFHLQTLKHGHGNKH